jgi:hypothetical protein
MKKEKFTPGPWTIYDDGHKDDASDIVMAQIDGENYDVCHIAPEIPISERKANACLIAAAPDMLEALQLVVERLSVYVHKMNIKNNFREKVAMEAARTAISKALGE